MERVLLLRSLSCSSTTTAVFRRIFFPSGTKPIPSPFSFSFSSSFSSAHSRHLSSINHMRSLSTTPSLQHLRRPFSFSPQAIATSSTKHTSPSVTDCRPPAIGIGNRRLFSADVSQLPAITDPDVKGAVKDLMAASWDELPDGVIHDVKVALSKDTEDKAGQEALANVFRAAEAVEHFAGVLVSIRMELDDSIGLSGEKVGHVADDLQDALRAAYKRYMTYLDAFGPDETYLRKKVEVELGTKMIHIKMRCSGLEAEWGKITVLGTSGLSGSYVEHRAP